MEINGRELHIRTRLNRDTRVRLALRYLQLLWPDSVVEPSVSDDEAFIYQSKESQESWDRLGRTDQNAPQMVQLIVTPDGLTFVHDGLDEAEIRNTFASNAIFS
ncbi:hypothetical protein [Planctomicrobium piriforme]|uniref:Uncharacterized protein n=1 Tax=Planctomicrobium piriforme TaxID=1576369 RepID=A0A1I3EFH7_9PLAN|nr:hypothetical protein [Planctomicrobium piriforme]SFH97666.1 hypothetical protein SAMN05421753_104199 [Planctomicrobium piriforme]